MVASLLLVTPLTVTALLTGPSPNRCLKKGLSHNVGANLRVVAPPLASEAALRLGNAVAPPYDRREVEARRPDPTVSDPSKQEDGWAFGLGIVLVLELVGPFALAVCAASLGLAISHGSFSLEQLATAGPVVAWAASEATFYLFCLLVGIAASHDPGPAPFAATSNGEFRERWRTILADPSQPPQQFIESWFYEGGVAVPSPAELLTSWALRRCGVAGRRAMATEAGGQQLQPTDGASEEETSPTPAAGGGHGGVAYARLSRGDVRHWMARALYAKKSSAALSASEAADLEEVLEETSSAIGMPLRPSEARTPGVESMCGYTDDVRWRHRPLLYYAISHFVGAWVYTPYVMEQQHGYKRLTSSTSRSKQQHQRAAAGHASGSGSGGSRGSGSSSLSYWYRDATTHGRETKETLVFIHGVGFGPAPYASFLDEVAGADTPVIAVELLAASQRVLPSAAPTPDAFADLLDAILDEHRITRAVIAGHSLGSAFANYYAVRDARRSAGRRRVGGVVLLDPIACMLHHARTTREFVYTPVRSCQQSLEDYLFKKELWTSIVIARQLSWHEGAAWVDSFVPQVPTLVAVGTRDQIVPSGAVKAAFGSWGARLRGVQVLTLDGKGHGDWLYDGEALAQLAAGVRKLRGESARIGAVEARTRDAAEAARAANAAAREAAIAAIKTYEQSLASSRDKALEELSHAFDGYKEKASIVYTNSLAAARKASEGRPAEAQEPATTWIANSFAKLAAAAAAGTLRQR